MSKTNKQKDQLLLGLINSSTNDQDIGEFGSNEESPTYLEIDSPDQLRDTERVKSDLKAVDWRFLNDETGFLTHDVHPYPAKFIPQIPGHLISRLSLRGDLVLDPFGGSGTTALEAIRLGRRALSIDANAVGTLVGRVKVCNLDRVAINEINTLKNIIITKLIDLPNQESLCAEYQDYIPYIHNIDKWFPLSSRGELAFIRSRIAILENDQARNTSLLALSRIILGSSFQESETRYTSKYKKVPQGDTLKRFVRVLDNVVLSVMRTQAIIRYGVCEFITADTKQLAHNLRPSNSVDLIVTSPPYGNANDYHLYHRFRLLWLGYEPGQFAKIEIGSHLRHQKESSGFDSYLGEMKQSLTGMFRVLKYGRYAALVIGDAIYENVVYQGAESIADISQELGFEKVCIIERQLHKTKRSFVAAGRRATTEKILILRKPPVKISVNFQPPQYRLWPYEVILRNIELEVILGANVPKNNGEKIELVIDPYNLTKTRKLVFTHSFGTEQEEEKTWQAIIENGFTKQLSARKEPKYVTHGLHPYKGKFYPQLAKALINICGLKSDAKIFDPFCGSGTTLLEGYLSGYQTFGCDIHPLAAKIAKTKIGILEVNPDIVRQAVGTMSEKIQQSPSNLADDNEQFDENCLEEIQRWFPKPVMSKINWLLRSIRRNSEGVVRDFLEVVLSSIIREISQQDPNDLRIRKRKHPIQDADVFGMYLNSLNIKLQYIEKFWLARGYSPSSFKPSKIIEGDSRNELTLERLGLKENDVDMILTSPPYATALPYIDTDRLSLLMFFGLASSDRRQIEHNLVGSREITNGERKQLEGTIADFSTALPMGLRTYLRDLFNRTSNSDVGFRRKNMPALLLRFFCDMDIVLRNCYKVLKEYGEAMIVIGDNKMKVDGNYEKITTIDFIEDIANSAGFKTVERINISVSTENLVHIKNAITENVVLRLTK